MPEEITSPEIPEISELDQLINAKVKAGLSRDIAEEVAKNQLAHNSNLQAAADAAAKAAKKNKNAQDK